MALATSAWRESLARSVRIQTSKASTRGAMSFVRTARRCAGGRPLIDCSRSKIASHRLTASTAIGMKACIGVGLPYAAVIGKMPLGMVATSREKKYTAAGEAETDVLAC